MSWLNLPVDTSGSGPVPPSSTSSSSSGGYPDGSGNTSPPTDWASWEFKDQFYNAIEEKDQILVGCGAEFPPHSVYWATGTIDGDVTVNTDEYGTHTINFAISGLPTVDPVGPCSGSLSRWSGYGCGDCLPNIPSTYDLIVITDYDDPYTWTRLEILADTYDSGSGVTTLTTEWLPAQNAVTANFIASIASMEGAQFRITKHHDAPGAGLTSRDRRPLKPNQREMWRGTVDVGWIDSSGNGVIQELNTLYDPSPYVTDGGALPLVHWGMDQWKNLEVLFFDNTGLLHRETITGNGGNQVGYGQSIYEITVTAVSGTFALLFNGNNVSLAYNSTATDIQTALSAVISGTTVSGSGPFTITFPAFAALSADGAVVDSPSTATLVSGDYIICGVGDKGQPGRIPEPQLCWNYGVKQAYVTHMPDDSIGSVGKPVFTKEWSEGDVCSEAGCNDVTHDTLGDAQYEVDNTCVGSQAGDWIAPDYWKSWKALQEAVVGRWQQFVNMDSPFGDGTDPSAPFNYNYDNSWTGFTRVYRRRHKYIYPKGQWIPDCNESGCQDPPGVSVGGALDTPDAPLFSVGQGGTLNYNTTYYYRISALNGSGETLASTEASVSTVETTDTSSSSSSSSVTITTNTYTVTLYWTPELGASSYNIYGRTTGGEQLLINVSAYSGMWTDDGSLTPSGALPTSNTTSTNCFGVGLWNFRDVSAQHLSVSSQTGFVADGGDDFATGVLSRYVGDNACDPFSGRGAITTSLDDQGYWARFWRGHYHKALWMSRTAKMKGGITYGTLYSIFDSAASWWTDGLNSGTIRVQGGNITTGGSSTVTDSDYNDTGTSKSCWFETSRYVGSLGGVSATPYSFFIMEVYSGGTPAGWTIAADGTSTYTAPTATGHSGSTSMGDPPTISSMSPSLLHATGFPQPVFVEGTNFQTGCTVVLTAPDSSTISLTPTTITDGELTLPPVTFGRGQYGTWSIVASNPTGGPSSSVNFTVYQVQAIPVASFAAGVFTFSATLATAATTSDVYLIREPKYESNRFRGRVVLITAADGTQTQLVCRFSDNWGLYFDAQENPIVGSYQIQEIDTGATLLLSESAPSVASGLQWCEAPSGLFWVQPTGTDSRGGTFRPDINYNLETKVSTNGYYTLLDDFGKHIPDEMYDMLIQMQWTKSNYSWSWTPCGGTGQNFAGYGLEEGFDFAPCSGAPPFGNWDFPDQIECIKGVMATAATCPMSDPTQCGVGAYDFFIDNGTLDGAIPTNQTSWGECVFIIDNNGNICQAEIVNLDVNAAQNYGKINGACYPFASNIEFYTYGSIDGADTPPSTFTETFDDGPGALAQGACNSNATYDDCKLIINGNTVFDNAGNPVTYHQWEQWGSATSDANDTDDVCSSSFLGNLSFLPTTFCDPTIPAPPGPSEQDESDCSTDLGWYPLYTAAIRKWEGLTYV